VTDKHVGSTQRQVQVQVQVPDGGVQCSSFPSIIIVLRAISCRRSSSTISDPSSSMTTLHPSTLIPNFSQPAKTQTHLPLRFSAVISGDSTKTSVFHFGRSVCSCCQTGDCWTSCFLCRWRACLERSSCRRHFSTFSVHFPKTFKTLFALVSWPGLLN